jgi:hypothetical protein
MKKEIIESIYSQRYASLKEDISKIISEKAVSVLEHMKVHTAKKYFSLTEADSDDKSWDRTLDYARQGRSAPSVSTHTGQEYSGPNAVSRAAQDAVGQITQGQRPSRDDASQRSTTTPTVPSPTTPAGRVDRQPLSPPPRASSGDQPVRTVRTQGGNYPVYKKDSETAQSFRDAFGAARRSGASDFEWQGRKYGTALAGERRTQPATPTPRQPDAGGSGRREPTPAASRPQPQSPPQGSTPIPRTPAERNMPRQTPEGTPVSPPQPRARTQSPPQAQRPSLAQRRQGWADLRSGVPGADRGPYRE